MEDLLRAITSNPILLFLIIGAILSFLQKGKEEQAKRETQNRGGSTGEGKQVEIDWQEIFRQEEKTEPKPSSQTDTTYTYTEERATASMDGINRSNELLEKYEKAKQNKKAAENIGANLKDSPIYKDDLTASKEVKLDFSNISKEEAIKGVVWSEILGKPRAKGSYRPSMSTRRRQG